MELFTIHCTTCRVRLHVKDEAVIGSILACPKCGSMVQVVPPVGWRRDANAAAASQSTLPQPTPAADPLTASTSSLSKSAVTRSPLPKTTSTAASASTGSIDLSASMVLAAKGALLNPSSSKIVPPPLPASAVQAAAPSATAPTAAPATESIAAEVEPAAPTSVRDLVQRVLVRDGWLMAAGLAIGVVLGVSVWLTLRAMSTDQVSPQTVANNEQPAIQPAQPAPPLVSQPEPDTTLAIKDNDDAVEVVELEPATEEAPVIAAEPAPAAREPAKIDHQAPVETAPPAATSAAARALRMEPLTAAAPAVVPAEPEANMSSSRPPIEPPRAGALAPATRSPGKPSLSRKEINERMSGPISSIRFNNAPLTQVVDFIGEFSGLVITFDDAALARVGQTRRSPVTVGMEKTTAAGALSAAVKSLGLVCSVRDGQVVITAAAAE